MRPGGWVWTTLKGTSRTSGSDVEHLCQVRQVFGATSGRALFDPACGAPSKTGRADAFGGTRRCRRCERAAGRLPATVLPAD